MYWHLSEIKLSYYKGPLSEIRKLQIISNIILMKRIDYSKESIWVKATQAK